MKLSDIFSYLTYGELAGLKVGGKDDGGIYPKYSKEVVRYVELALTALHSRFALKHNEVIIQQFDQVTMYPITKEYATSNLVSTQPYKWVIDTEENPFTEDIIQIEEIYNEIGEELFINRENENAIFTPQYNTLQIIEPVSENSLAVIYKADHAPLDLSAMSPKEIEVDLPPQLVQALCLYVSSLAHTSVGSPEGIQTGFGKMQEYEAVCLQTEIQGTIHKETWTNDRIRRNGWV